MADPSKDISGLDGVLKMLEPKRMRRVERSVVNKSATAFKKDVINLSGSIYFIKKSRLKKTTGGRDNYPIRRMGRTNNGATISFKWLRPNLKHFSPNKAMINRPGGLKYRIKKGGSLKKVERGFFQTMQGPRALSAARNAFQRKGKEKWPVKTLTGPSPWQMYQDDAVGKIADLRLMEHMETNLKKAFDKEYGGKK